MGEDNRHWPKMDENDPLARKRDQSHLTPEFRRPQLDIYADIPKMDEIPAMDAWEKQNAEMLSKLSKRKQRNAYFDALDELRVRRAREQVEASSPDEPTEPDAGNAAST